MTSQGEPTKTFLRHDADLKYLPVGDEKQQAVLFQPTMEKSQIKVFFPECSYFRESKLKRQIIYGDLEG